jgi:hypothetical protein
MTDECVSKEIAHNIFLLRRETPDAIVYTLDNAKYKRVVFKMDFRGSENLRLRAGGGANPHLNPHLHPQNVGEMVVAPYSKVEVAYLCVVDPRRASQLRVKYSWEERDPHAQPAHLPKREELAPDVFLYTTRTSAPRTEFHYAVFCGKYKRLRFTVDFRGSSNLRLPDGTLSRTVYVDPYEKQNIGVLVVQNPSLSWSLKSKYTWVEEDPPPPPPLPLPRPGKESSCGWPSRSSAWRARGWPSRSSAWPSESTAWRNSRGACARSSAFSQSRRSPTRVCLRGSTRPPRRRRRRRRRRRHLPCAQRRPRGRWARA